MNRVQGQSVRGLLLELFTKEQGMPPATYLCHQRLQHAQTLLRDGQTPMTDVARLSGFGGLTQQTWAFKKAFGVSPHKFRRSADRPNEALASNLHRWKWRRVSANQSTLKVSDLPIKTQVISTKRWV